MPSRQQNDRLLPVSDQRNPIPLCKYSSGQQNNVPASLSRVFTQCYFGDSEQTCVYYVCIK